MRALEQKAGKDVRLKAAFCLNGENAKCVSKSEAKGRGITQSIVHNPKYQLTGSMGAQGKNPVGDVEFDQSPGAISTVYLGDIPTGLRVSELKGFLRERNSVPLKLTWQGAQHRAFLEYSDGQAADWALASLQGLTINGHTLQAERAKSQKGCHKPSANKGQMRTKPQKPRLKTPL